MNEDPFSYYKELEVEINKRIHASTNCRSFTLAFGRALEAHLKRVRIHRRLTTRWLNRLGYPHKDELASISVRFVECEEKIDHLDDEIYLIMKNQRKNHQQIKILRGKLEELLAVLENEERQIQNNKIKTLEKELFVLKSLFKPEIRNEDNH